MVKFQLKAKWLFYVVLCTFVIIPFAILANSAGQQTTLTTSLSDVPKGRIQWEDPIATTTNTTIIPLNYNGYDYGVNQTRYQTYFKSQLSAGDAIQTCRDSKCFTIQPSKLTYRNNFSSNDDIYSSPNTSNIGYPEGNNFKWDNIFGTSDISYTYEYRSLKENLVLESVPRLPAEYLGNTSLITFDLDTYIKYPVDVDIYVDGVKKTTDFTTTEPIEFRNASGFVLYYLPKPYAIDNAYNQVELTYQVVFDGNYNPNKQRTIFFYTKTPYEWLNSTDRVYPVRIDPSVVVLNKYTYPQSGDIWTVYFNTSGTGNLTISSPNAYWTEFLKDNTTTSDELQFLNISCGDTLNINQLYIIGYNNLT